MGRRTLLLMGLGLLAIAGCGPLHPLSAASTPGGTIPWKALPADLTPTPVPSPQAMPVPPGTRACTAGDLAGVAVGSQGATGHVIASFAFAGTSTSDCYVDGTPTLTALDSAGKALLFTQRAPFFPPDVTGPQLVSPGPVPEPHTALKYGQTGLTIDWVSQPEACPGQRGVTIAKAVIAIPGGGSLTIALPPAPQAYACQRLGVGSFESPPIPVETPPPPPLPGVKVKLPESAVAGKPFDYLVTLTNNTKQPMNLAATCPNYEEELFADIIHGSPPLGGKHFYMLNCAPAGTLAPGRSATFQMVLNVPADAKPGTYTVLFALRYSNNASRPVETPVQLTA
ncbi:MAG: hypothetical protein E6I39_00170 [Chloroflexi bacterium]|nr:MAG: hypothetical protein E6I39_00170 [Chloroflexota bacterium]